MISYNAMVFSMQFFGFFLHQPFCSARLQTLNRVFLEILLSSLKPIPLPGDTESAVDEP